MSFQRALSALTFTLLSVLCLAALAGCESRYGPGDRPSNFGGTVMQTGQTLWLEDLRGQWVLVDMFRNDASNSADDSSYLNNKLSPGRQHLRFKTSGLARLASPGRRLTIVHVLNPSSTVQGLERLIAATPSSEPLVRVAEPAGWAELECQQDYLISPSGVVVMAEPDGYDWSAILPAAARQSTDFSPLRVAVSSDWQQADQNTAQDDMQLLLTAYRHDSAALPCRLELELGFADDVSGQQGRWHVSRRHMAHATSSFEIPAGHTGEVVFPVELSDMAKCEAINYSFSVWDARLGTWVTRHGTALPGESGVQDSGAANPNSNYDSEYRAPSRG